MADYLSGDFRLLKYLKFSLIAIFPLILWLLPPEWISEQHSICLYKNITGHECWGCGTTRAIISAIHFRFSDAILFNKSVIIVLPVLAFIWAKTLFTAFKEIMTPVLKNPDSK
jgi:hypothetical protein